MNNSLKKKPFFWKSNIVIIILFIFVVLVLQYWQYDRVILQEKKANLQQAEIKAKIIDYWLLQKYQLFESLVNSLDISINNDENFELIQSFIREHKEFYNELYYIDYNYNRIDEKKYSRVSKDLYSKYFDVFKQNNKPILGNATISKEEKTKKTTFTILAPIYGLHSAKKNVKGIAVATFSLDELKQRLSKLDKSESYFSNESFTWILDSQKKIVLDSNTDVSNSYRLDQATNSLNNFYRIIEQNNSGAITYSNRNQNLILSFVKTNINSGWIIVVGDKQPSYMEYLLSNWSIILIEISTIILGMIIWQMYLQRKIIEPFIKITKKLEDFNEKSRLMELKENQFKESSDLSKEINSLIRKNILQTHKVEDLIQQRTKTLSEINSVMASKNQELNEMNSALSRTNDTLQYKAKTDALTQLLNRQEFIKSIEDFIKIANQDPSKEFSVLFLDLDNFKKYNDNFSHDVGDFILKSIAELIRNSVRSEDLIARYGGDEFVIMINHNKAKISVFTAYRILNQVTEAEGFSKNISELLSRRINIAQEDRLSCSIGVVHYSKDLNINNAEELITLADNMMYQAKKAGKARVVVYPNHE